MARARAGGRRASPSRRSLILPGRRGVVEIGRLAEKAHVCRRGVTGVTFPRSTGAQSRLSQAGERSLRPRGRDPRPTTARRRPARSRPGPAPWRTRRCGRPPGRTAGGSVRHPERPERGGGEPATPLSRVDPEGHLATHLGREAPDRPHEDAVIVDRTDRVVRVVPDAMVVGVERPPVGRVGAGERRHLHRPVVVLPHEKSVQVVVRQGPEHDRNAPMLPTDSPVRRGAGRGSDIRSGT